VIDTARGFVNLLLLWYDERFARRVDRRSLAARAVRWFSRSAVQQELHRIMRKLIVLALALALAGCGGVQTAGQCPAHAAAAAAECPMAALESLAWEKLFATDLSDATAPEGVWTIEDGVLTASQDQCIWTKKEYENFVFDAEFKTADATNSGVIVYCSNTEKWIPNSVEIQIADDFAEKWAKSPASWHCGAIFGHVAPTKSMVKKPGEWNRITITCKGPMLCVMLNGEIVSTMDMSLWTSEKKNPDGTDIPNWLSTPLATLPTKGRIGLQGKHGDAPIWFKNVRIAAAK
jgi:hypothetical protein